MVSGTSRINTKKLIAILLVVYLAFSISPAGKMVVSASEDPGGGAGLSSIGGFIWVDGNGMLPTDWDGLYNGGESPLEGCTVYLYDAGDLSAPLSTAVTGPDGLYIFEGLEAGEYVLGLESCTIAGTDYLLPMMMTGSCKFAIDWGSEPLMAYTQPVQLTEDEDIVGLDAGMRLPMGIVPASNEFVVSGDMSGAYNTLLAAVNAVNNHSGTNYTITISKNEAGDVYTIKAGKNVIVKSLGTIYTLKPRSLFKNRHFEVNGSLTLENIVLDGVGGATVSGGIVVNGAGSVTMGTGAVIQNCQVRDIFSGDQYGGAVYMNGGTFTMNPGSRISGNRVWKKAAIIHEVNCYGGAVFIANSGKFTMNGGEISGNSAEGTFTDGAKATYVYGGAVYVESGTFTMKSGALVKANELITDNPSNFYFRGTAVYVEAGSFVMDGGEVSSHVKSQSTGTVYVQSGASFVMNGGTVKDNSCLTGGGVYADGQITMTGGQISGNATSGAGGGIYTTSYTSNYNKVNIGAAVVFSGNSASALVLPPSNAAALYPNIATTSSSNAAPYDHPLNNYDINITSVDVTVYCAQKVGGASVPGAPGPVTYKAANLGAFGLDPAQIPTVSGWIFTDWKVGSGGALQGNTNVSLSGVTSATSIYLLYEQPVNVTVYYRDGGNNPIGTPSQAVHQVVSGQPFSLSAAPYIPMFEYIGWKIGAGGAQQSAGVPVSLPSVTVNTDIYLIYQANAITGVLDLSETTTGGVGYTVSGAATSQYSSGIYGGNMVPSPGRVLTFGSGSDGKTYRIIQSGVRSTGSPGYDADAPKNGTSIYKDIFIGDGVNAVDVTLVIDDIDLIGYITVQDNCSLTLLLENTGYYAVCSASYVYGGIIVEFLAELTIDDSISSGASDGKLSVTSSNADGYYDAAIGGFGKDGPLGAQNAGSITINGGAVTAVAFPVPTGNNGGAAIGGGGLCSATAITITGGIVNADGYQGAGIGGGMFGKAGVIGISGGEVNATGYQGAAIGSGRDAGTNVDVSVVSDITISGGTVTATKTYPIDAYIKEPYIAEYGGGAGIGGGEKAPAGTITIEDGVITATGSGDGAGIGGGAGHDNSDCDITISGGTIVASGRLGAGIGAGGAGAGAMGSTASITITGGNVTATSTGINLNQHGGAGIGGGGNSGSIGYGFEGGNITISGGTVTASGNPGAGIGGGNALNALGLGTTFTGGHGGNITITGSSTNVTATGSGGGAGIGGGAAGAAGTISISDATVTAINEISESGHGYSMSGTIHPAGAAIGAGGGYSNLSGSSITIDNATVTATSESSGAAIGGGSYGDGGLVLIEGGVVDALNEANGAAIGGGAEGTGGNITIEGGTVTATGYQGAGIGGGSNANGGSITINDGIVTAEAVDSPTVMNSFGVAAGIGGGDNGDGGTIAINGGIVAASSTLGAGIGGGRIEIGGSTGGAGGNITISGGSVTAFSAGLYNPIASVGGAGIGGGSGNDGGNIIIEGGMVDAEGVAGAGIGGGSAVETSFLSGIFIGGDGGIIAITGSDTEVTAKSSNGAGIGGGEKAAAGDISISDATVTAKVEIKSLIGGGGAAIGAGGGYSNASGSVVTINSGLVDARNESNGAGIGGGYQGSGGVINIKGGDVTAIGSLNGAGIGGGAYGADGGTVTIDGGTVTAATLLSEYGSSGAGIGGGDSGNGGDITINAGKVEATGSAGAGIGGGENGGNGGNITINGGTVTAVSTGVYNTIGGAGIGGGPPMGMNPGSGAGGNITINGGMVTATGNVGAGIGGGWVMGIGGGPGATLKIDDSADVWAYSLGGAATKPAIDANGPNGGDGYYVNARLEPAELSTTMPIDIYVFNNGYSVGDPGDRINTLTMPVGYRCFGYTSGQTSTRSDNLYADLGTNPAFSDPDPDIRLIDRVKDNGKPIYSVRDLVTYYNNIHSDAADGVLPVKLRQIHTAGVPSAENIKKYKADLVSTDHELNGLSYVGGGFDYSDSLDSGGRPDDPATLVWPEGALDGMPASPKVMNTEDDPAADPLVPNTKYYLITYLTALVSDMWLVPPLDPEKRVESEVAEFVTKPSIASGSAVDGAAPGDVKVSAVFEGGEEPLSAWICWDTDPIDPLAPETWEFLPHIVELDFGLGEFGYAGFDDFVISGLTNGTNILIVIENETGWDSYLLKYLNAADVTVSKTVTGEYAEKNKAFTFTLTLKDSVGNPVAGSFAYVVTGPALAPPSSGTITLAGGKATFPLKDGQQITIEELPAKAQINIAETPDAGDFYNITFTDSLEEVGLDPAPSRENDDGYYTPVGIEARTFAFLNEQKDVVPTGFGDGGFSIEPWLIIALLDLLAIEFLRRLLRKRVAGRAGGSAKK